MGPMGIVGDGNVFRDRYAGYDFPKAVNVKPRFFILEKCLP